MLAMSATGAIMATMKSQRVMAMFYWLWRVRIRRTWRWNRVAART